MTYSSIPRLVDVPFFPSDDNGALGVVEASKLCGFQIKRHYYLLGGDDNSNRGAHAHKGLFQFMTCLRGQVSITFKNEHGTHSFDLDTAQKGIWVPPGYWRDLTLSPDAVLSVLASEEYTEDDYIRSYDDFIAWEEASKQVNTVPYIALDRCHKEMKFSFQQAFDRVVDDSIYIGGDTLHNFEAKFAAYCDAQYAIGCGNGLDALTLILKAMNIGAGDEVIVPANSFIATALAVEMCGAVSVFAECDPDTYSINVKSAARKITQNTKAIIPVHLYGIPAPMDDVMALADKHDLYVIEDAAQAHGAMYKGRKIGGIGHAAAFSFYPTKNMGALGDGGCVTTNDPEIAKQVRMIANYGSEKKYHHIMQGVNTRLDTMQAAFLDIKLDYIDGWTARRRDLADIYFETLLDIKQIKMAQIPKDRHAVWHVFPVRVAEAQRDALISHLSDNGVGTNIHYPFPIHKTPAYNAPDELVISETCSKELISLPLDPYHSEAEIRYVCAQIKAFYDGQ